MKLRNGVLVGLAMLTFVGVAKISSGDALVEAVEGTSYMIVYVGDVKEFKAQARFVSGLPDGPRINAMNENFQGLLGVAEDNVEAVALTSFRLYADTNDGEILRVVSRPTVKLATLYELLLKQPNGEKGFLLTDGAANVFYVPKADANIFSVGVDWEGGGWNFYAHSTDGPKSHIWRTGRQVVIPVYQ